MPSAFNGRSWESKYIQSIDVLDSIGTSIRIAVSSNSVMRIIPSLDEFYDEWLTNKARFVYDLFLFKDYITLNYVYIQNLLL
jgi:NADH dehydrogenase/NADH:ubiquinone oxidoreductase subunit G